MDFLDAINGGYSSCTCDLWLDGFERTGARPFRLSRFDPLIRSAITLDTLAQATRAIDH
jgi:hypothetical protein